MSVLRCSNARYSFLKNNNGILSLARGIEASALQGNLMTQSADWRTCCVRSYVGIPGWLCHIWTVFRSEIHDPTQVVLSYAHHYDDCGGYLWSLGPMHAQPRQQILTHRAVVQMRRRLEMHGLSAFSTGCWAGSALRSQQSSHLRLLHLPTLHKHHC